MKANSNGSSMDADFSYEWKHQSATAMGRPTMHYGSSSICYMIAAIMSCQYQGHIHIQYHDMHDGITSNFKESSAMYLKSFHSCFQVATGIASTQWRYEYSVGVYRVRYSIQDFVR